MPNSVTRPLGALEKLINVLHDELSGSTSVCVRIEVNMLICPDRCKQVWEILFARHPLLRAVYSEDKSCLHLQAAFSDIPHHIELEASKSTVDTYFGETMVAPFVVTKYLWRFALLQFSPRRSVILFSALHGICDTRSISALLSEWLTVYKALGRGDAVSSHSAPLPGAVDQLLNMPEPSVPQLTLLPCEPVAFFCTEKAEAFRSCNYEFCVQPDVFAQLRLRCKAEKTTMNGVLCAALAKAVAQATNLSDDVVLPFSTAVSLRSFLQPPADNSVLAFYAHQVNFQVSLDQADFWQIARTAKQDYSAALAHYQCVSDDESFRSHITEQCHKSIAQQQYMAPYTVSNVGDVTSAFAEHQEVDTFRYTIRNGGFGSLILFVSTLQDDLFLTLNYCEPACPTALVKDIANKIVQALMASIC